MVNTHFRKWLGVPRNITSDALYSSIGKQTIPTTSLGEEFKVAKARMYMLVRDSKNPAVRADQPKVDSGRKWKVAEAVEEAESIGFGWRRLLRQDHRGLGWKKVSWGSRGSEGGRRVMVSEELRSMEEEKRVAWAVCQPQQGSAFTVWESVIDKYAKWSDLRNMEPSRISFLLWSVYHLLPTSSNQLSWNLQDTVSWGACGKKAIVEHAIVSCNSSLQKFTWWHNKVLLCSLM